MKLRQFLDLEEQIKIMKKYFYITIILIHSLNISAQIRDCVHFVSTHNFEDTIYSYRYCREYITDNIFSDSLLNKKGVLYMKNEKDEWYFKHDTTWLLFFDNNGNSNYIVDHGTFSANLIFEKTKLTCNGSPIYHVTKKPICYDCYVYDLRDYYFTPKDGFIIRSSDVGYYIRKDLIHYFRDYIIQAKYLNVNKLPF